MRCVPVLIAQPANPKHLQTRVRIVENVRMRSIFILSLLVIHVFGFGALAFEKPASIDTVVIDPGHGGYSIGIAAAGSKEKDIALSISQALKAQLDKMKIKAHLTRSIDRFMSVEDRRSAAADKSPDVMLSVHMSGSRDFAVYVTSYGSSPAKAGEPGYYSLDYAQKNYLSESNVLAGHMEMSLLKAFGVIVKHREMPVPLLNKIGAPAVMIEVPSAGIDYKKDIQTLVNAIIEGIIGYGTARK